MQSAAPNENALEKFILCLGDCIWLNLQRGTGHAEGERKGRQEAVCKEDKWKNASSASSTVSKCC